MADTDRFALVTLRGTDTLLQHFSGLLECARASRDSADFEHRLSTDDVLSGKSRHHCDEIRNIVAELEGVPIGVGDVWSFLRLIYVLSFDLATGTGQTEAQIKTLPAHTVADRGIEAASSTWNDFGVLSGSGIAESTRLRARGSTCRVAGTAHRHRQHRAAGPPSSW